MVIAVSDSLFCIVVQNTLTLLLPILSHEIFRSFLVSVLPGKRHLVLATKALFWSAAAALTQLRKFCVKLLAAAINRGGGIETEPAAACLQESNGEG